MTRPVGFALPPSDLHEFLFADVEVQSNGMPLIALSLLARLGADPWDEAERLAALPYAAAVSELSASITILPCDTRPRSDPRSIATRLVALLPARSSIGGVGNWI